MSEVEAEGSQARSRPLSGGLWTLFSWLRRDERSSSSDSLSSAGSDRTAVSFAFHAPPPHRNHASPLPPLSPPTDSYRKRVHDGNLRKQHDRNLTLHRKYGLYYGYDAFSLPSARKNLNQIDNDQDRERRANSESFPRRSAYVPGKRRAPLPPSRPHSVVSTASLTRRHIRKRPAPQPPVKFTEKPKENIENSGFKKIDIIVEMNSHRDRRPLSDVASNDCRSEKNNKSESNKKETRIQKEKSFLKQIFENKRRNSAIETAPERILPSISELDKQAADIINSCKLKPIEKNNNSNNSLTTQEEAWFCTRCLRRYNSTIVTCQHCLPEQKRLSTLIGNNNSNKNTAASAQKGNNYTQTENEDARNLATNRVSGIGSDEKQKLKEMLKEMKDSLPKKSKQNNIEKDEDTKIFTFNSTARNASLETPTLRVESKATKNEQIVVSQPSTSKDINVDKISNITEIKNIEKILPKIKSEPVNENVVITQHVVLVAPQPKDDCKLDNSNKNFETTYEDKVNDNEPTKPIQNIEKNDIHTPLKISSLLNPVYIPKYNNGGESPRSLFFSRNEALIKKGDSSTANSTQQGGPITKLLNGFSTGTSQSNTILTSTATKPITSTITETKVVVENCLPKPEQQLTKKIEKNAEIIKPEPVLTPLVPTTSASTSTSADTFSDKTKVIHSNMTKFTVDQHSRRRDLINQLEQSIAKGDERAAAEAAIKLAQLRLSCSVLSFSSQIMAQTSGSGATRELSSAINKMKESPETTQSKAPTNKVHTAVQPTKTNLTNTEIKTKIDPSKEGHFAQPEKKSTLVQTSNVISSNIKQLQKQPCETQDKRKHKLIEPEPSTSKQNSNENGSNLATIQIWVEDRESTRGPVKLRIPRQAVMGDLRRQAETSLGLVSALQRWIVGRALCTDDSTPLVSLAGPDLSGPFYLCVVETDGNGAPRSEIDIASNKNDKTSDVYSELVQLEQRALVVNAEPFECGICMEQCPVGGGAVLRECVHTFCKECLSDLIKHCEEPVVGCPAMGCPGVLQEREIRTLVTPQDYERWLARGLAAAESGTRNAFHCRTRDCTGWAFCDPGVRRFPCPVCKHKNCIPCQAIHEGDTCEQYQKKLQEASAAVNTPTSSQTDEGTRALLDTLIEKGEALQCPECSAIITKKWGCDWVKCSACKTEICWVTRGRRWGPGGKGDTSGGCRCGVDGKRCHPSCGYCH